MADLKDLVSYHHDESFRKGACHGAAWLVGTTQTLVAEGRTAADVHTQLHNLLGVLSDWRSQTTELPDGNPWDWSFKDLAAVLRERASK